MSWTVLFHDAFDAEFQALDEAVQDELLAHAKLLGEFGPNLGRPTVDGLKGSKHANMKELRFMGAEVFGALPSPLTRSDRRFCWWVATRAVPTSEGFTSD